MFLKFKKDIVISCECSCGDSLNGHIFEENNGENEIFLDFKSCDFNIKQGVFSILKENLKVFCGKRIIKDIIVKKEDLIALKKFLLSVKNYSKENLGKNDSHIIFRYDEDFGYLIYLISDLSKKDALKCKLYRTYSLALSEEDRDLLVYRINKIIKKVEGEE